MRAELKNVLQVVLQMDPMCYAAVLGSDEYADLEGTVWFYPFWNGTLVIADVAGLPGEEEPCGDRIFGFHIHEGTSCSGNEQDPFADTGEHFNPGGCPHPAHAGDFPPLLGNDGYALTMFYTNRFLPEEVEGKTVVIHSMPDDFRSQPSGDAGQKIACGVIESTV